MLEVTIARLGAQGDGIADLPDGALYVAGSVPGDRVRVEPVTDRGAARRARVVELLAAGPARVEPPCRHFGDCGGCALQHVDAAAYAAWKRGLVVTALSHRGFADVAVEELMSSPPASRRRARFAALRLRERAVIGFNAARGRRIVPLAACHVLRPAIVALLPGLAELAAAVLPERGATDIQVTETDSGLDVWFTAAGFDDAASRMALAEAAERLDLARLSVGTPPETVAMRRAPAIDLSGVRVELPADAFLQATAAGEAALVAEVRAATAGAARIADLYAGVGTFSFAVAATAQVHAAEGTPGQASALAAAYHRSSGLKSVTAEARDLHRRPLLAAELARFDAVVFDPPRVGAARQAAELARSGVPLVVAVSCNPATFARDARTLADGGYRLTRVLPVDQFLWSPHLELVGVFQR